ncbi:uncharacterized protein LOC126894661 isoform X2 [Daktulosphaira vitifoliae]|uniref:uncharacterized protein LOC126894661 isoform X2 n=1 Tax=Daktulosphaira vitifoliae TaxID=58002 RepID=UPI0021A98346|nr:uncharacterized protein LOC126894661 isoform X2 [Daktulosphaira vitifoliae]
MSDEKEECELEEIVIPDENSKQVKQNSHIDTTPPITPKPPPRIHSQSEVKNNTYSISNKSLSIDSQKNEVHRSTTKISSTSSLLQDKALSYVNKDNLSNARLTYVNERLGRSSLHDYKPPRPPPPNFNKLQNKKDVTDVRQMEQALQQLLEDFHSGKLRAFGKDCSMEQMTAIREQQEHLAWLHFELGVRQDGSSPLSEQGIINGSENMHSLMASLEQLSLSIEKLHSFSNSTSE